MDWTFSANGRNYSVTERRGNVIDVQIWSETRVSSYTSGGGGTITNGSGYISAPTTTVSSSVHNRMRVFTRWDDGGESSQQMDHSVPFRVGNRLSEIYLNAGKSSRIQLQNLDTGRWLREKGFYERDLPKLGIWAIVLSLLLGLALLWLQRGDEADFYWRFTSIATYFADYLANPIFFLEWASEHVIVALPLLVWSGIVVWRRARRSAENRRIRSFWAALEPGRPKTPAPSGN